MYAKVYKKYVERIQKGFKKDTKCMKKYAKSVQNGFKKYPKSIHNNVQQKRGVVI